VREVQDLKLDEAMISTDAGMQIDVSDEQSQNVPNSIRFLDGRKVNDIFVSERQDRKQFLLKISTEAGQEIDPSDKHPKNASSSIRFS
jgi:hypothetical protein